jgi:multiple sugar transport system substrate-binding protein
VLIRGAGLGAAGALLAPRLSPTRAALAQGTPTGEQAVVRLLHSIPTETETFWEDELLPEFERQYPGCVVQGFNYGSEDPARIRTAVQAGGPEAPNAFWLASSEQGAYTEAGLLADVQGFLDAHPDVRDSVVPSLLELSSYDGAVRTLPWMTNNLAMWINLAAFEEAGLEAPSKDPEQTWTWEEFADAAAKLTTDTRKGYLMPVNDPSWDSWSFHAWIAQAGGEFLAADGTPGFADDPGIAAMTFLKGLVDAGATAFSEPNEGAGAGPWYAGNVAIHLNGPWNFPSLSTFTDFPFDVVPYPRDQRPATNLGGDQLYILDSGEAINACAFNYGAYMLSDPFQIAFNLQSGNFPVTTSALQSEEYQAHIEQYPWLAGWINQIPFGVARSSLPYATDVFNAFDRAYNDILLNNAPIAETLAAAAAEAESLRT